MKSLVALFWFVLLSLVFLAFVNRYLQGGMGERFPRVKRLIGMVSSIIGLLMLLGGIYGVYVVSFELVPAIKNGTLANFSPTAPSR